MIAEINLAINELESVVKDGGLADHPGLDSHLGRIPRLNKAAELGNKARDNVQKEDDNSGARDRALQHIAQAHKFVEQAIALEQ